MGTGRSRPRKSEKEELKQNEKLLNDILDCSPIPQFVIGKDHRVLTWNRALEAYSGVSAAEVVGTDQHWRAFYKEKRPIMADLLVDGEQEKIAELYAARSVKCRSANSVYEATDFLNPSGGEGKWMHFTASVIRNAEGEVVGAMETLQDVTEWRRAEQEVRESSEYLNQILNSISDPIFVKDREHRYVLVNDALCELEARPREVLLGKESFDDLPPELAATLAEREAEVFRTGNEGLSEDVFTDRRGIPHTLLAKKALLIDKKGEPQIIGVLRDISQYKRLEAQFLQAQKMEAIGVLAGGVAHDFNNLLNVINGYCELILEGLSEEDPNYLDLKQISQAGQRAASLIAQLLAFSRKQILQPAILGLNDAIAGMRLMLHRLIRENIELRIIAEPGLGFISADPVQIQQIVMNLAVNAQDAMLHGGKLTIETANVELDEGYVREHPTIRAGRYVLLAISDNGIGMDEATKSRLFEPFFTTKAKGKGTGLGLSTVYGIVKQSNGYIWVYSEPGKGTSFKIYFPRVEGENILPLGERQSVREPEIGGFETVLLAEDESSVRSLAARILRERGYTVLEACNGQEALRIVEEYPGDIHLVLTDVVMPGMSGRDLVLRLEKIRPGIRALYISGYADNAIVHNGTLDSGIAFLQKPFKIEALVRRVREVIDSERRP